MWSFLKKIFGRKKVRFDQKRDPVRYEQEKKLSQSKDVKDRLTLAKNNETHQEILYYLAEHDPSEKVRLAVAKNEATPVQASPVLAGDSSADVRMALAERLVKLLPHLDQGRQSQMYAYAVQALATLALDEVLKIRKALSTTLKDYAHTPPKVASQLAHDVEQAVSEPILRFCTALADEDLLDILKGHPAPWAVQAIARRDKVSGEVSKAIIEAEDPPAGIYLMENPGAEVGARLLEAIVDKARLYPEWQKPAAVHKNLPVEMAQQLADFADASVREILMQRDDFDKEAIEAIARIFKRRLGYMDEQDRSDETPTQKVVRLDKARELSEDTISDALAVRDTDLVYAAVARLAKTNVQTVKKIFGMQAAKPIVALCWKAELSMRMALKLQQELGQVPPKELMYPRGGTDYPMTKDEIIWQLDFLGLEAA